MRNKILFPLFLTLVLSSCGQSNIFVPNKVFENDDYNRIGAVKTKESNETLNNEEKAKVQTILSSYENIDKHVTTVISHNEIRDLQYAYFGSSVPTNFKNYRLSEFSTSIKFVNLAQVIISDSYSEQETSLGNVKNKLSTKTYTFDVDEENNTSIDRKYETRIESKVNDEEITVTSVRKGSYQKNDDAIDEIYGLKPIKSILDSFSPTSDFKLFGDNAVYNSYTQNDIKNAVICDAVSEFFNYKTSNGREYKAVNNYFYEAHVSLLDNPQVTYFRKYSETLILSDDVVVDTPVLYLEKPALIKYEEKTYEISYDENNYLKHSTIPQIKEGN